VTIETIRFEQGPTVASLLEDAFAGNQNLGNRKVHKRTGWGGYEELSSERVAGRQMHGWVRSLDESAET
jgi:hypothetical protein